MKNEGSRKEINRKFNYLDVLALALLLLMCLIIIWNNLSASVFYDWDETRHAENALTMLRTGNYITPYFDGKPDMWNFKPPFSTWLITFGFRMFGANEFGLRFFSALFATLTIGLVYFFGREIKGRLAGLTAGLVLLSVHAYTGFHSGRTGDPDALVIFFMTASLFLFYLYEKKNRDYLLLLLSVSLALGFMTKNLVGLIPLGAMFFYSWYKGSLKKYVSWKTLQCVIIFLLLTIPWLVLRYLDNGKEFVFKVLTYDIMKRGGQVIENHPGDLSYYFNIVSKDMWYLATILLVILAFYSYQTIKRKNSRIVLVLFSFLTIFLAFTIAKSKLEWYILPVYPFASLLIGFFISDMKEKFNIKYEIIAIVIFVMLLFPIADSIKVTNNPYLDSDVKSYRELIPEFKKMGNVWYYGNYEGNKGDFRQALLFTLKANIKGELLHYKNASAVELRRGEYIVTVKKDFAGIFSNRTDLELIKKQGNAHIFRKI